MPYSLEYFNERVLAEIERWPVGILADYARLVELLAEFGADLRMPHTRALGSGLFETPPPRPRRHRAGPVLLPRR